MKTKRAIELAQGRDNLARLLHVETVTTYHWKTNLTPRHERYLRAVRPQWFEPPGEAPMTAEAGGEPEKMPATEAT